MGLIENPHPSFSSRVRDLKGENPSSFGRFEFMLGNFADIEPIALRNWDLLIFQCYKMDIIEKDFSLISISIATCPKFRDSYQEI